MKTLTSLMTILLLSVALVRADDMNSFVLSNNGKGNGPDVNGYAYTYQPGYNPAKAKAPPNPHAIVKPELGGIFVDGAKYGWEIISPAAPITWGNGEKYMTAPDPRADLLDESGPAAHRQSGGFKLFSIEF